jgi:hypothetical protein
VETGANGGQPATLEAPQVTAARSADGSPPPSATEAPPPPAHDVTATSQPELADHRDRENTDVDLGRIAWVVTVLGCVVAVVILVLEGYYGYAGVTFAVGAAAAINLT